MQSQTPTDATDDPFLICELAPPSAGLPFQVGFLVPSTSSAVDNGNYASPSFLWPHQYTSSRSTASYAAFPYTHQPLVCQCNILTPFPTTALIEVGQVKDLSTISHSHLQQSSPIPLLLHQPLYLRNHQILLLWRLTAPSPRPHCAQHSPSRRQRPAVPPNNNQRPLLALFVRKSVSCDPRKWTNDMGGVGNHDLVFVPFFGDL